MSFAFLRISDVRGEATDPGHLGWIEAISFGHLSRNPNEISITKTLDSTSALLFHMAEVGKSFEGEIDVLNNGRVSLHYDLKGAIIAAFQLAGHATDEGAIEHLTLACQSVETERR